MANEASIPASLVGSLLKYTEPQQFQLSQATHFKLQAHLYKHFGIAEEIIKNLGSRAIDEIASAWGFKPRLEKLKTTINTIKDVLLDAEDRQTDSRVIRGWLERLAAVVYAADDLFDEVATVASQKQMLNANKLSKKVHTFFSSSNQALFALNISKKIKTIRQELDDIVKEGTDFAFAHRPREEGGVITTRMRRDQTYSFVDAEEVIGRDDDKKAILDILFASGEPENEVLHVIPIVGIGGQGKTTLAQLIYNDPQVDQQFELRLWVCVSEVYDIKSITEKILKSATNAETPILEMEQLQGLLRNKVGDKRYLLVLDDIWNESREEWLKLRALLKIGRKGSKIIVTTRSREVAKIMGTVPAYDLQGLLEEKAWELFQKMAFEPGKAEQMPRLMEVGKDIVKKCANVPLAIRAVGSLLYGKNESKWLSVKDRSLANILDSQNGIMDILKLSYQQLQSPLKNCFAYGALFPKDHEFNKEALMNLWMAEGFIISRNNEDQSLEELAEEYFLILLQRCFFQDIKRDEWGNILSCKMHDFMHDLAQQVAGVNCKVAMLGESNSNKAIYHLSLAYRLTSEWKIPSWILKLKHLRTFLLPEQFEDGSAFSKSICQELISGFGCLRVLDLHNLGIRNLPSSIGKLIHLRYLNLSCTPIRELPDSITMLQNLQTLNLYGCECLRTLPINMGLLKNLRSLDVGYCISIKCMPSGLGKLTSLNKLPRFKVVYKNCPRIKYKPNTAELSDLQNLNNLKGVLHIEILGELKDALLEATVANLEGKHGLTKLHIELDCWLYADVSGSNHDETILEGLKPHPNLRELEIYWYRGQKFPSWAMMGNLCSTLPNLVHVELLRCGRCQQVPCFSQLPFLKRLSLVSLQSVEYMESSEHILSLSSKSPIMSSTLFFPSLQELTLMYMDNLQGWWNVGENADISTIELSHDRLLIQRLQSMSFSNLKKLFLKKCPKLISLPQCPNVEELTVINTNKSISVSKMATASPSTSTSASGSKLKKLTVLNLEDLISLPRECLHQLSSLVVQDNKLVSSEEIEKCISISSSLRCLSFTHCHSLRIFAQGLEHLTAIEKLALWDCEQLDLSPDEDIPWKYFKSLRSLKFNLIPKLLVLPSGLQHLTNLRSLKITCNYELKELPEWSSCFSSLACLYLSDCPKLTSLPEAFCNLTALNKLNIIRCPGLTDRYQGPKGSEWPKIQHIPLVQVLRDYWE